MKNISLRLAFYFVGFLLIRVPLSWGSTNGSGPRAHPDTVRLTILHTNDHHGHFWVNSRGEMGLPARKTLIDGIRSQIKKTGGELLLLSGGDINTGTPASDRAFAEPDFRGMSLLGYDAMAVGNHEFDHNLKILLKQQKEWSNFPFLSANIFYRKTGKRVFAPYKIFKKRGLKIAVVGFTTLDTLTTSNFPEQLMMKPPIEVAKTLIPSLRKESDVVIALTHMGHYRDGRHGHVAAGDVTLARSVDGIDLVVGGHTQQPLFTADIQNGTAIVQAYEWGKYVGRVDLDISGRKVKLASYKLIPVNLKDEKGQLKGPKILEDKKALKLLKGYWEAAAFLRKTVGTAKETFVGKRKIVRHEQTNIGHLINYANLLVTKADSAIISSGSIRSEIEKGVISREDLLKVHPFGGTIVRVHLTKKELFAYMQGAASKSKGTGGYPQILGLQAILSSKGQLLSLKRMNRGGVLSELEEGKIYTLATTRFLAGGGDDYPKIKNHRSYEDLKILDVDALSRLVESQGVIDPNNFKPQDSLILKRR